MARAVTSISNSLRVIIVIMNADSLSRAIQPLEVRDYIEKIIIKEVKKKLINGNKHAIKVHLTYSGESTQMLGPLYN